MGEVDAERAGGPHRLVECLLARRTGGVQDHERGGVEPCHETALEHLARAREGRPVDPRRRGALAVRPQAVDLELGGGPIEAPRRAELLALVAGAATGATC